MRCIQLTGSDNRMDCASMWHEPLNPLPPKCPKCGFPDLDHVPQPYFLVKSRTMSSNETALAHCGNLLVRERVRHVLEVLAPGQCNFYPTCFNGTTETTPWHLAVPTNQVCIASVQTSIPRCDVCREPRSAHPGTQFDEWLWNEQSEHHLLKSSTWGSSESGWPLWIDRNLFMSRRFFHLLKQLGAKGLDHSVFNSRNKMKLMGSHSEMMRAEKAGWLLDEDDTKWISQQIAFLSQNGIAVHASGTISKEDATWFRDHVKRHAAANSIAFDLKAAEKGLKFKLPKSYKEFIAKVGARSFNDVDEEEGFTANVLAPDDFDCGMYRQGKLEAEDDESNSVDGVMFANTGHGDCFCFDIQKDRKEYAVYLYNHEGNFFEPYADNFVACIRRFVGE